MHFSNMFCVCQLCKILSVICKHVLGNDDKNPATFYDVVLIFKYFSQTCLLPLVYNTKRPYQILQCSLIIVGCTWFSCDVLYVCYDSLNLLTSFIMGLEMFNWYHVDIAIDKLKDKIFFFFFKDKKLIKILLNF